MHPPLRRGIPVISSDLRTFKPARIVGVSCGRSMLGVFLALPRRLERYGIADSSRSIRRRPQHPIVKPASAHSPSLFVGKDRWRESYFLPVSVAQQPQKIAAGQHTTCAFSLSSVSPLQDPVRATGRRKRRKLCSPPTPRRTRSLSSVRRSSHDRGSGRYRCAKGTSVTCLGLYLSLRRQQSDWFLVPLNADGEEPEPAVRHDLSIRSAIMLVITCCK
nr:hypothetical protein CFP56_50786 [Quercus suber]